jgi:structural maintenance of chromosome 3 (chondroitin sulfate proteoglycan 6)
MSLLEGAGFSKSNPYFIVQQGKVNALCTMSDTERLQLLKEVAGTTVYDEKKEESLAKMEENKVSMEKINETLTYMENKLDELKDEKEELDAYQKLDRDRRAVEYTLYDMELRRAREGLDEVEHARNEEVDKLSNLHEEVRNMHERILAVQAEESTKKNALKRNAVYVKSLENDKTVSMTHKTKLALECRELEEQLVQGKEVLANNQRELAKLHQEIRKVEKELAEDVQPAYDDARSQMLRMSNEREEARKRMEGLYAKQGRGKQFRSKKERDAHLQSQIKELNSAKSEKEELLHEKQSKLSSIRKSLTTEGKEVESKLREIQDKSKLLEELVKSIDEKKRLRNEMADSRKEQWRIINELSGKVHDAKEASRKALYDMRKSMPRATSSGLDALKQIVVSEGLTVGVQYFGLVMENFALTDDKYATAVEVAAQNSLFHIIVDNDATAARLMKRLEDEKLGRVTFLPLNQLNVDAVRYPESTDVAPLMEQCITFQPAVRRAMEHVFARKLLARSVDVASTWSTRSNMDAITLDGDLCSRKGALTGGFVDIEKSRLRAHYTLQRAEDNLRKLENAYHEKKEESTAVDQQVSNVMGEVQRLEAKHANLDHMIGRIEDDLRKLTNTRERHEKLVKQIAEEDIPPIESQIASLTTQVECLEEEVGTELTSKLSDQEQSQLDELKVTQTRLDDEIEKCHNMLEEATIKRQKLTCLLEDNLIIRRNELTESSSRSIRSRDANSDNSGGVSQAQMKEDLEHKRRELEEATQTADEVERQLAEVKKIDEKLRTEIRELKNHFDKLKTEDAAYQKELEECHDSQEKLLNKVSVLFHGVFIVY